MKKKIIILLTAFLLTGCSKKDGVIIYTSMEEERNQALKTEAAKAFPDLDISIQFLATGNSAAKLKTEGTDIEADIILGLETSHVFANKESFADLSDFNQDIYLDEVYNANNYFVWEKSSMGLIIDKSKLKKLKIEVPKTYEDLLKKEYKNLIAMPDPKTSNTGYGFYLNVVNIMGKENAIEYFKKLKNNLREFTTSGSGPTNLLKQGEIAIALGMYSQGAKAINDGYKFEIVELNTGSPYNTTSFGIIKGREKNENVKKVFNWLLNDFCKYDKENFMPDIILKNQDNKVANYPSKLKSANMDHIDDNSFKNELMERWNIVNG